MSPEIMTLFLFGSLLLCLAIGIPISFALGGVALLFTFCLWGQSAIHMAVMNISGLQMGFMLVCVPLFIFMGVILEKSGIADDLFNMMYQWIGPFSGGLAIGTVLICTLFAAMSGISAVGTVVMGVIALPAMLKRNYNKTIALGSIMAGGALGILIPPSIMFILYGFMANVSIGQLFIGGIIPGLILSSLFIIYIAIRCRLQPHLGPPVPPEQRLGMMKKFTMLSSLVLPVLLVIGVLGSIFMGVASPTEAAAIGAFGSIICAVVKRRLNWALLREASMRTLSVTCMALWITIGAQLFTSVYAALGGQQLMINLLASLEVNRWIILIAIQISLFFLGMIMDPIGIILLTTPIYVPAIKYLGFSPVWFGVIFVINMEMAYLTPPFGFNLFYMKGIAPPEVSMADIYRSVIPFVILQAIGLAFVIVFPQLAMWLPSLMIK